MSMNKRTVTILAAFAFSGASALIYEVIWTRALSLVLGSTTYALSTMLSTFMAGLMLGGYFGGKLADRRTDLPRLFGLSEAGIGITALLTLPLIYELPAFYLYVYRTFHLSPAIFIAFQFVICCMIMLIPTTLMGFTFPLVSRSITQDLGNMGSQVGNAYAANTFGAIIGAASAGFILLPYAGIKASIFTAAGMNLMVSAVVLLAFGGGRKTLSLIVILFAAMGSVAAQAEEKTTFLTFYTALRFPDSVPAKALVSAKQADHELLYYREHPEGAVRLYRERGGFLLLQTGGKLEGTTKGDMPNTLLLAHLPVAAHPKPSSMLVVGLGVGVTLGAAKEDLRDVELVEINPGVVEAIRRFGPPGLMDGVVTHIDDARQYLFRTDRKFDIISSEPSYPSDAAIANLFTKEYYELARERLNPGGIYCQWLPYYILRDEDMEMMSATFGSVFRHVMVWKVNNSLDRIMIGSMTPFSFAPGDIAQRIKGLNKSGYDLAPVLSRGPEQIAALVQRGDIPINTDDRPILEFRTVRNIIAGGAHAGQ